MKNLRKMTFVLSIVFALISTGVYAANETPKTLPNVNVVDTDSVKRWLDDGEDIVILDPRKTSDFNEKGHIPTSINCPVGTETDIESNTINKTVKHLKDCDDLSSVSKDAKIIAYCNGTTCWMSPKAALALVKMGYHNVNWMRTGIKEWSIKGFPME